MVSVKARGQRNYFGLKTNKKFFYFYPFFKRLFFYQAEDEPEVPKKDSTAILPSLRIFYDNFSQEIEKSQKGKAKVSGEQHLLDHILNFLERGISKGKLSFLLSFGWIQVLLTKMHEIGLKEGY